MDGDNSILTMHKIISFVHANPREICKRCVFVRYIAGNKDRERQNGREEATFTTKV